MHGWYKEKISLPQWLNKNQALQNKNNFAMKMLEAFSLKQFTHTSSKDDL